MVSKVTLVLDNFSEWLNSTFKWVHAVLMFLIVYEVTCRYVFNAPNIWGMEVQMQISAVGRMVGIGYCPLKRSHVRVDVVTVHLSLVKQRIFEIFGILFLGLPSMGLIGYSMYLSAVRSWGIKELSFNPWREPIYPMKAVLTFCYAALIIAIINELIKDIETIRLRGEEWLKDR